MAAKIPGIKAQHAIISDACRRARGDDGAFGEAAVRLKRVYDQALAGRQGESGVEYHLVLTVLPPDHRDKDSSDDKQG